MPSLRLEFYALALYIEDSGSSVFERKQDPVASCSSSSLLIEHGHVVHSSAANPERLLRLTLRHIPQLNDAHLRGRRQKVSRFVRQPEYVLELVVLSIKLLRDEGLLIQSLEGDERH